MVLEVLSWIFFPIFIIIAIISILWSKNHKWCLYWSGFFVIMGFISKYITSIILTPLITSSELKTATELMSLSYFIIALVFAVWGIYCLIYSHLKAKVDKKLLDLTGDLVIGKVKPPKHEKRKFYSNKERGQILRGNKKVWMEEMGL